MWLWQANIAPLAGHPCIGDVCLVAKVGLGAQRISGGPEFTDWENKIDAGSSPGSKSWHQNVRKNTTHKESSREKSHVHRAKINGRPKLPGWPGKMVQELLSAGLALSRIWEKARARDRQREVAGNKGQ
jgi:hypothetical protein